MDIVRLNRDLDSNVSAFACNAAELKRQNPAKFRSIFGVDSLCIISRPVINKFGWWVLSSDTTKFNIPKLKLFHLLLTHYGYISCSYKEFEAHFIGGETSATKIVWEGDVLILVLLFNKLIYENSAIPVTTESFYDLLFNHFLLLNKKNNRAGKLKHGSLKSSLSNAKVNCVVSKTVENFIVLLIS